MQLESSNLLKKNKLKNKKTVNFDLLQKFVKIILKENW